VKTKFLKKGGGGGRGCLMGVTPDRSPCESARSRERETRTDNTIQNAEEKAFEGKHASGK